MKIYIFADMEGISGISGSEFVSSSGRLHPEGRRYYTADINACAEGCVQAGADRVLARDGHAAGNYALWDELHPKVELIQGAGGGRRLPGVEECDGLILLGYHAMAGTRNALLEHTYSSGRFQNVWLNGRPVGETGIDAGIAGEQGIPTILVTGDDRVCREAEEWVPGVVTCQVKTSLACQGARLLPREEAHDLIRRAAAEAVGKIGDIAPVRVEKPVTMRLEMIERGAMPNPFTRQDVKIVDGRMFEVTGDSVERVFLSMV